MNMFYVPETLLGLKTVGNKHIKSWTCRHISKQFQFTLMTALDGACHKAWTPCAHLDLCLPERGRKDFTAKGAIEPRQRMMWSWPGRRGKKDIQIAISYHPQANISEKSIFSSSVSAASTPMPNSQKGVSVEMSQ